MSLNVLERATWQKTTFLKTVSRSLSQEQPHCTLNLIRNYMPEAAQKLQWKHTIAYLSDATGVESSRIGARRQVFVFLALLKTGLCSTHMHLRCFHLLRFFFLIDIETKIEVSFSTTLHSFIAFWQRTFLTVYVARHELNSSVTISSAFWKLENSIITARLPFTLMFLQKSKPNFTYRIEGTPMSHFHSLSMRRQVTVDKDRSEKSVFDTNRSYRVSETLVRVLPSIWNVLRKIVMSSLSIYRLFSSGNAGSAWNFSTCTHELLLNQYKNFDGQHNISDFWMIIEHW